MFKVFLKKVHSRLPSSIKNIISDSFSYIKGGRDGAVSLNSVLWLKNHKKVAVLGNGPSLKKDRDIIKNNVESFDFICVNNFCDDALYTTLKPKMYLFLDAYFFSENAHPDWVERRKKTFEQIEKTTSWPMTIFLPHSADESILKFYIKNKNIEIIRMRTQSLFRDKYSYLVGKLYDSGVYGPPQINVLIYGIYLAIIAKYSEVYVFGADLSFHHDVFVDQKTNDLFVTFKHFNEEDKVEVLTKNPDKLIKWKMSEFLHITAETFCAHEVMNEYAKAKNIKIYNASSQSLIDAYERVDFSCPETKIVSN
jgi:hypothetical protein